MSVRKIPISGLPLLVYKLRTGGLGWARERLWREWQMPTTRGGRALYRCIRAAGRLAAGRRAPAALATGIAGDTLYAFYDLAVAPITFDFLWFLVGAEVARRRIGVAGLHAVIVPGREAGLRKEDEQYESIVDPSARQARVGNILVPACRLLPSAAGVSVAASRAEAAALVALAEGSVFPEGYEPALPLYPTPHGALGAARAGEAQLGVLRAAEADLRSMERWLAARGLKRRIVTITLRSYGYMSARNSKLDDWVAFARRLDRTRYDIVFVPDTEQVYDGIPRELDAFVTCTEAAVNLGLRMALYERAFLNLGVNGGPMGLCWFNPRAPHLTFKILADAPQTTPEYMRHLGFEIGKSLPGARPWEKWVWEDDDLEVIEREFAAAAAALEAGRPAMPPP